MRDIPEPGSAARYKVASDVFDIKPKFDSQKTQTWRVKTRTLLVNEKHASDIKMR